MQELRTRSTGVVLVLAIAFYGFFLYWPSQLDPHFLVYGQATAPGVPVGTPPVITLLSPSTVVAGSAGMQITISGGNFTQSSFVFAGFSTTGAPISGSTGTYVSPVLMRVFLPASALNAPAAIYIYVVSSAGASNTVTLNVLAFPVISGMVPASAVPGSSFVTRILGQNLANVTNVGFGSGTVTGIMLPGGSATVREAQVTVGAAASGSYTVSVTDSNGTAVSPNLFSVQTAQPATSPSLPPLPIPEVENGTTQTGYVVVTADSVNPIVTMNIGMVRDGVVLSQAGVLGSSQSSTVASMRVDHDSNLGRTVGLALMNASTGPNQVSLTVLDERGVAISSVENLTVPSFGQVAKYVSELLPSGVLGTSFKGSVLIRGTRPFAVMGLRFNGPHFFPVSAGSVVGLQTVQTPVNSVALGTALTPSLTVFPQFALGGGWATQISIVETQGVTTRGQIAWFDANGNRLTVSMNGVVSNVFLYTIPPGGSFVLAPRDSRGQTPF